MRKSYCLLFSVCFSMPSQSLFLQLNFCCTARISEHLLIFDQPSRHNYAESTLNPRHGLTLFPRWYLVPFENWINIWFSMLIPRHVFHVDSTCFPRWIHVFSTLNQRDVSMLSQRQDIWFYMKVDSMCSFQRWIYVMFSTLNPHNIFNYRQEHHFPVLLGRKPPYARNSRPLN